MLSAQDWRPAAAYVYIIHLDGSALAWEYLRRNLEYQNDWRRRAPTPSVAQRWGLRSFENPLFDARTAEPSWVVDPDNLTRLTADRGSTAEGFNLWIAPGHKRLIHDGHRLLLTNALGHQQLRVALDDSVQDGQPVAFLVSPDDRAPVQYRAIERLRRTVAAARAQRVAPIQRPDRAALLHMRGLQALDGDLAGATQRTIAIMLFGADAVEECWEGDDGLRIQTRNLLHRARAYLRGGYHRLLSQFAPSAQGKSEHPADLP